MSDNPSSRFEEQEQADREATDRLLRTPMPDKAEFEAYVQRRNAKRKVFIDGLLASNFGVGPNTPAGTHTAYPVLVTLIQRALEDAYAKGGADALLDALTEAPFRPKRPAAAA